MATKTSHCVCPQPQQLRAFMYVKPEPIREPAKDSRYRFGRNMGQNHCTSAFKPKWRCDTTPQRSRLIGKQLSNKVLLKTVSKTSQLVCGKFGTKSKLNNFREMPMFFSMNWSPTWTLIRAVRSPHDKKLRQGGGAVYGAAVSGKSTSADIFVPR